jgi:hypothetical protein
MAASSRTSFRRRGPRAIGRLSTMAPRRLRARVNWALRWGGLAGALGVTALVVLSLVRGVAAYNIGDRTQHWIRLWRGNAEIKVYDWRGPSPLDFSDLRYPRRQVAWLVPPVQWPSTWLYEHKQRGLYAHSTMYRFPLWPFAASAWTLTGLAWWMAINSARATQFACPSCHYDLSGLPPGSPCPECATATGASGAT